MPSDLLESKTILEADHGRFFDPTGLVRIDFLVSRRVRVALVITHHRNILDKHTQIGGLVNMIGQGEIGLYFRIEGTMTMKIVYDRRCAAGFRQGI